MDRGGWQATVMGSQKVRYDRATKHSAVRSLMDPPCLMPVTMDGHLCTPQKHFSKIISLKNRNYREDSAVTPVLNAKNTLAGEICATTNSETLFFLLATTRSV